jgi:hypothetical protein
VAQIKKLDAQISVLEKEPRSVRTKKAK